MLCNLPIDELRNRSRLCPIRDALSPFICFDLFVLEQAVLPLCSLSLGSLISLSSSIFGNIYIFFYPWKLVFPTIACDWNKTTARRHYSACADFHWVLFSNASTYSIMCNLWVRKWICIGVTVYPGHHWTTNLWFFENVLNWFASTREIDWQKWQMADSKTVLDVWKLPCNLQLLITVTPQRA